MKIVRILVLSAAMALVGTSQGVSQSAPSAEALQAAREFASLTSVSVVREIAGKLTSELWPTMESALRVKNPNIDAATLAALRKEFEELQAKSTVEALVEAAPIYARYFTADELRQLVAFYRTPIGAKALTVMPRASVEMLQALGPRMQSLSDTVNQRFAAILQQRGYKP